MSVTIERQAPLQSPEYAALTGDVQSTEVLFARSEIEKEAWALLAQRETLPVPEMGDQEYKDNARTALLEAMTAAGHLSTIEISGTLEEINAQILNRLLNGLHEGLPRHEWQRRFAELCNELTIQKIHRLIAAGKLPADYEVLEISDYPEALQGQKLGYRDSNKKGMVRSTALRRKGERQYTRVIEQVSRSNSTASTSHAFYRQNNVCLAQEKPDDLATLDAVSIYSREKYLDGVVDINYELDIHAGQGVRYGDTGEAAALHPEYQHLRQESLRREQDVLCYIDKLGALEKQLDGKVRDRLITRHDRYVMLGEEINRILNAVCTLNPEYSEATFGKRAVHVFQQASYLVANGHHDEAGRLLQANAHLKEIVTFCGMTLTIQEAQDKGLLVNSFGELVETGKESWRWKPGKCVVKSCPSPNPTEVGPCSVCRHCQREFDKGRDPTKDGGVRKTLGSMAVRLAEIIKSFGEKTKLKTKVAKKVGGMALDAPK